MDISIGDDGRCMVFFRVLWSACGVVMVQAEESGDVVVSVEHSPNRLLRLMTDPAVSPGLQRCTICRDSVVHSISSETT